MVAYGPHAAQKQPTSGPARQAEKNLLLQKFLKTFKAILPVARQHSTLDTGRCCENVCLIEVVVVL